MTTEQSPKFVTGDGINTPDLKLFAGAYITITYWQASPDNNQRPIIYIKNDSQPEHSSIVIEPNLASQLANALVFIDQQVNPGA